MKKILASLVLLVSLTLGGCGYNTIQTRTKR
jgi:predicted small secreted protein